MNYTMNNPFMDAFKMMAESCTGGAKMQMPMMDMGSMMNQTMKTMTQVNKTASECMQTIMHRGSQMGKEMMENSVANMSDMMKNCCSMNMYQNPEMMMNKQANMAKNAMETTMGNVREMAEMWTKSGMEIFDAINQGMSEVMHNQACTSKKKAAA